MESLYRKYRPQTFNDVVGQKHIVATLRNALAEGRQAHAYLFCGPRGTGKTTTARLLAKALLCEHGPTPDPDGTCEQCRQIAAGTHPDVYELDAASRTGVDNVREEIINRVAFAPTVGRYKVYIIDEVHMLSPSAFNALLKTLEEPPAHVVFVMCTTNPLKIPETVQSRCQRLEFHRIATEEIEGRLADVCAREGFAADREALELIARHSRGGMRDALSMLEQLSVFGDGAVRTADVQSVLGEVSDDALADMVRSIASRDVADCFRRVAELADRGTDIIQYARDLTAFVRDLYVVSVTGPSADVLSTNNEPDEMASLAVAAGGTDRLARMLDILGQLENRLNASLDQRLSLEVALTRMARPAGDLTVEALAERVSHLEKVVATLQAGGVVTATPVPAPSAPAVSAASSVAPAPAPAPAAAIPTRPASTARANVPASQQSSDVGFVPPELPWLAPEHVQRQQPAAQVAPAPQAAAPSASPSAAAVPAAAATPARQTVSTPVPAPVATPAAAQRRAPAPSSASAPDAAKAGTAASGAADDRRTWNQVMDRMLKVNASVGALMRTATGALTSPDTYVITNHGSAFALRMLERPESRRAIEGVVAEIIGHAVRVEISAPGGTPARTAGAAARPSSPASVPATQSSSRPAVTRPASQPAPASRPTAPAAPAAPAPTAPAASQPASAPAPAMRPTPAPAPATRPAPAPAPQQVTAPASRPAPAPAPRPAARPSSPAAAPSAPAEAPASASDNGAAIEMTPDSIAAAFAAAAGISFTPSGSSSGSASSTAGAAGRGAAATPSSRPQLSSGPERRMIATAPGAASAPKAFAAPAPTPAPAQAPTPATPAPASFSTFSAATGAASAPATPATAATAPAAPKRARSRGKAARPGEIPADLAALLEAGFDEVITLDRA